MRARTVRMKVLLTEEQSHTVKQMAAEQHTSVAEIVRRCVDSMILSSESTKAEQRQRALALSGPFSSGKTDISVNHDEYLAEAYAQ